MLRFFGGIENPKLASAPLNSRQNQYESEFFSLVSRAIRLVYCSIWNAHRDGVVFEDFDCQLRIARLA